MIGNFKAVFLILLLGTAPLLGTPMALKKDFVTIEKESSNNIEVVKTFLKPRSVDGKCRIWVFFIDKDPMGQKPAVFSDRAVPFTQKTLDRRIRTGRNETVFGDLPVSDRYIEEVVSKGAHLRRISRWLNAASFEVPLAMIDQINNLPFVARVRPVAVYRPDRPEEITSGARSSDYSVTGTAVLDYGASFAQLEQVRVPYVHNLGYNGSGIIVAMFDTGYRKDHQAFAAAMSEGRVLAEYDFIFNDGETQNEDGIDASSQHNHGTYTWSTLGGAYSGQLYGPAYGASFILAKTEDVRSETKVEEDNWMAAMEWADSIGADIISSSLAYSDWYTYGDMNGETAVTTIAANTAAELGIVVCNAMSNSGPGFGSLHAPADAFDILSCGAVDANGYIASFSSRGPTADGRIKPEVCARGVYTYSATPSSASSYGGVSGTSLSTPIIGGCAALYLSVYPSLSPQTVRQAFMETANNAGNPDNAYGWGIVNMEAVLDWGAKIGSDVRIGQVPLEVNFIDSSYIPVTDWKWFFTPDDSTMVQNPSFGYSQPGEYPVQLSVITNIGRQIFASEPFSVIALADTLSYGYDTVYAGQTAIIDVNLANTRTLQELKIPVNFSKDFDMVLDSFSVSGTRAEGYSATLAAGAYDSAVVVTLLSMAPLAPGSGPILRFFLTTDPAAENGLSSPLDSITIEDIGLKLTSAELSYVPLVRTGMVTLKSTLRGDANNDNLINVGDAVFLVSHIFDNGPYPATLRSGDANNDISINVGDVVYLLNHIFHEGPAPNQ